MESVNASILGKRRKTTREGAVGGGGPRLNLREKEESTWAHGKKRKWPMGKEKSWSPSCPGKKKVRKVGKVLPKTLKKSFTNRGALLSIERMEAASRQRKKLSPGG